MDIVTVCGMGTSLILKMSIDDILKKNFGMEMAF